MFFEQFFTSQSFAPELIEAEVFAAGAARQGALDWLVGSFAGLTAVALLALFGGRLLLVRTIAAFLGRIMNSVHNSRPWRHWRAVLLALALGAMMLSPSGAGELAARAAVLAPLGNSGAHGPATEFP